MRYKAGWFIPQQIMALTHFVPVVTPDDFAGITEATNACLLEARQPFHLIIDNRVIESTQVIGLNDILGAMPQLQDSQLRWIVIVSPKVLRRDQTVMRTQHAGDIRLQYAEDIEAAFDILRAADASLKWELQQADFFADAPI
jgi:hypothetical protein